MSEFIFGYKSPTHEVHVQIPVCLLGKPDPDVFNFKNIVGQNKPAEETPVEEKKSTGFFSKTPAVEDEKEKKKDGEGLSIATGVLLLSSMVLAALH